MSSDNGSTAPPTPPATPPPAQQSSNFVLAALGYPIGICALIAVLIEKTDTHVRYHGWNALFWNIAYLVVFVALIVVKVILGGVPGLGRLIGLVMGLLPAAFLIMSIIFAVKAYNRQPVKIPVISDMARKQVPGA